MPRVVVYLRFARPREGVKDPPLVRWTAAKERELWGMLRASSTDLDWAALARHFDVSLVYILQQAAWLYEKELGLLRRKMSQINMPPAGASLAALRPAAPPDSPRSDTAPGSAVGSAAGSAAGSLSLDEFEDSGSDVAPAPSRRLLSASRIAPLLADSASESDSDSSMDAFLPAARIESHRSELSSSFSDNSVSQSALEEALLEQVNARRRADAHGDDSPTSPTSPASPAAPASPQASTHSTHSGASALPTP